MKITEQKVISEPHSSLVGEKESLFAKGSVNHLRYAIGIDHVYVVHALLPTLMPFLLRILLRELLFHLHRHLHRLVHTPTPRLHDQVNDLALLVVDRIQEHASAPTPPRCSEVARLNGLGSTWC